tara:strand:- start:481 stop:756 length:276 start_codon:yes stop_codon:yes gene_type:complete
MKKILSTSIFTLFLTLIFSFYSSSEAKTAQEIIEERCNKSIFTKIKCKTDGYNLSPTDYFKKRKRCSRYRDQADTVYQGKQIYKQCMEQYR